jgi:hypothetical protein
MTKPSENPEIQEPADRRPRSPEEMIEDCMRRATKITYRKRRGKKGTSITIEFKR